MKLHRRSLLLAVPSLLLATHLHAEEAAQQAQPDANLMLVSAGSKSGTYWRIIEEFSVANPGLLEPEESTGSVQNIDRVLNNKAEMGISQLDALVLRAQKEPGMKERIRVLMPLFLEEVHFIAKAAGRTEGGWGSSIGVNTGIGATKVILNSIDDLKGLKVGFWGGSSITEEIVSSMALTGWAPVQLPSQEAALNALRDDQIDAILAVGGQPLGWVANLDRTYKLLTVPDNVVSRLAAVYEKASLSYGNLGQDGVQTLAVRAMLITQNYHGKIMLQKLAKVRKAFTDSILDIREQRGTHPKWNEIQPNATTDKWPMLVTTSS